MSQPGLPVALSQEEAAEAREVAEEVSNRGPLSLAERTEPLQPDGRDDSGGGEVGRDGGDRLQWQQSHGQHAGEARDRFEAAGFHGLPCFEAAAGFDRLVKFFDEPAAFVVFNDLPRVVERGHGERGPPDRCSIKTVPRLDSFRRIDRARFDDPWRQFLEADLALIFRPSLRATKGDSRAADWHSGRARRVVFRRADGQLVRIGEWPLCQHGRQRQALRTVTNNGVLIRTFILTAGVFVIGAISVHYIRLCFETPPACRGGFQVSARLLNPGDAE